MLYFIEAPFDSAQFDAQFEKKLQEIKGIVMCQFCEKKPAETETKTCSTCRRRLNTRPRNIWADVPRRPVWRSYEHDEETGLFTNTVECRAFSPESYEDDPGGSFDNARRAREDGR